ncbi:MAG: AlpA family phage regulatory protein [Acidobacteria bacterium]|nr:AlpA family phage regulatory protein [Acidobacteriota bacterium]
MTRKLLNRHDVEGIVKMPRSTLYQAINEGDFPKPIRIGKRSVRWFEDEIVAWMEGRERGGSDLNPPRDPSA